MTVDVWALLPEAQAGVARANERVFTALYTELRRLAERQLLRNSAALVSPTTLLHETYLVLAQGRARFPDRAQFMGYAARVMRGLIIDFVRQRRAQKRGGQFHITRIDTERAEQAAAPDIDERSLMRLSEALNELAEHDLRLSQVVDLKYFCGFSFAEIAAMRDVAERTVKRDWDKARLFLFQELGGSAS